jgi:ribosomal protein S18 acetylase RimI-like enzyme
MMSRLKYQIAKPGDEKQISDLVNSAYRGESSKKGWTTEADLLGGQRTDPLAIQDLILNPQTVLLCAFENSKLIGVVQLQNNNSEVYLGLFTIDPSCQAQGFGKVFLEQAEKFCQHRFAAKKIWMTVITARAELVAWYERRGYKKTGQYKEFPYGDERFGIPKRPDLKMEILEKLF